MSEPELHVRDFTPSMPAHLCDSGRHIAHPGDTCEEIDELQAMFRAYLERALQQAYARAAAETERIFDKWFITGQGTGEPRGIADWEPREETSIERALAILDPHLRACPLYQAGPPTLPWP